MNVVSALRRSFRRSKRGRKSSSKDDDRGHEEKQPHTEGEEAFYEEVGVVRKEREKEERERETLMRRAKSAVDIRWSSLVDHPRQNIAINSFQKHQKCFYF